jgi:hypothetical protein
MTNEEIKLELARARAFVRGDEQHERQALEASRVNSERRTKRSENYSDVDSEKPATPDFRIAEMTAEHERQLAELKREVESLKADHTVMDLQQFAEKLDGMLAKANELVERLDRNRAPLDLPSPLAARRSSSVN